MEDELAAAGRGVDALLKALEAHAFVHQVTHRLDEMWQRPPQPIQLPDDKCILLAAELQRGGEARAICLGSTGRVGEDLLAASSLESIHLKIQVLFVR